MDFRWKGLDLYIFLKTEGIKGVVGKFLGFFQVHNRVELSRFFLVLHSCSFWSHWEISYIYMFWDNCWMKRERGDSFECVWKKIDVKVWVNHPPYPCYLWWVRELALPPYQLQHSGKVVSDPCLGQHNRADCTDKGVWVTWLESEYGRSGHPSSAT